MSNNSLGTAGVALYADTAEFSKGMDKAAADNERAMRRIAQTNKMAEAIVTELGRRMALGAQIAEDSGASFRRQSEATARARDRMVEGDRSARQMAQGMQALALQSNDVFVSLASGQNPLMVLIQQGAQVSTAFGGVGETLRGIGSLFTLTRVAAFGLGGGLAYAAYQMYQGREAAKDYERQLLLSGNAAGVTEQRTREMAAALQATTGATGLAAREAVVALATSGRVSGDALEASARALIAYQRLSGATTEEALKLFDKQAAGAAKWAADVNKSYNFITAAEFARVKAMEDAGDKMGAYKLVNDVFAREMRARDIPNLGYLATSWRGVGQAIDWVKEKLQSWGAPNTLNEEVRIAEKILSLTLDRAARTRAAGDSRDLEDMPAVKAARERLENLRARLSLQEAGARGAAELAAREQQGIQEVMEADKRRTEVIRSRTEAERVYQELIRNAQRPDPAPRTIPGFRKLESGGYEDTARAEAERIAREDEQRREAARREAEALARDNDEMQRLFGATQAENDRRQREMQGREGAAGFFNGVNGAAAQWWADTEDKSKRGSELFVRSFQTMEDAVAKWARTGKFEADAFWSLFADAGIRELTRLAQQKLFFDDAGGFLSSGSGIVSAFKAAASIFGFANGISYVPYDGMPAVLHEGERVLTKQENLFGAAAASRGGGPVFDFSGQRNVVGPGVSLSQVQSMVSAGNAELEQRIRRLMREGVLR